MIDREMKKEINSYYGYIKLKEIGNKNAKYEKIALGILAGMCMILIAVLIYLNVRAYQLRQEIDELREQLEEMQEGTAYHRDAALIADGMVYRISNI